MKNIPFDERNNVVHTLTNSQALEPDEQVSFRLVEQNRVPIWQASNGRTFPRIAGGSDDPPDGDHSDDPPGSSEEDGNAQEHPEVARLRREAAQWRRKVREHEAELERRNTADKARADAEKSEVERLREQLAEADRKWQTAQQQRLDTLNQRAIEVSAMKANAVDPETVYRLLNPSSFETNDEGTITNTDALVKDLLKDKPYLVKPTQPGGGVPATPRPNGQPSRDDGVKELQERLRSNPQYHPQF